jgi:hypothetical protein
MSRVLIGTDVEYWKDDSTSLADYELALRSIGSKTTPSVGPYGPYHSDQVWAERASRPCASLPELLEDLEWGKIHLETEMGMTLQGVNWIDQEFDEFEYPFLYEQARQFGCSPDMHAGRYRTVPSVIKERPLREAGAHIHFNLPREYTESLYDTRCPRTGRVVLMEKEDKYRRLVHRIVEALAPFHTWEHPGVQPWFRKPGVYRLKPYGIEYRSIGAGILSNPDMLVSVYGTAFDLLTDIWEGVDS